MVSGFSNVKHSIMDFEIGDVVRFKGAEFKMVVTQLNAPKFTDGTGQSGKLECRWFNQLRASEVDNGFVVKNLQNSTTCFRRFCDHFKYTYKALRGSKKNTTGPSY